MTKLRAGDVVAVPVDDSRWALAHILRIYKSNAYYFEFHESTSDDPTAPDLDTALASACILAGLSFDARVHSGDWRLVGHRVVGTDLRLPPYLLGRADRTSVEDFDARRTRSAEAEDIRLLRHRKIVSPLLLEQALQAHFGQRPWAPHFDGYRCPSAEVLARAYFDDG